MRIAIVDDNEALAKGIAWRLQDRGHATDLLHDGNAAADFLRDDANDIVILDINLPGINGLEILREMRNRGDHRPVLLLTARDTTAERVQGLDAGADDFLTKPVNAHELRARITAGERIVSMERQLSEKNRQVSDALEELREIHTAIDNDLRQARTIQQSLVPERICEVLTSRVSLLLRPCGHVGGDLVGVFKPGFGRLGLYSIDVSGHGITSAMVTARVAGYLSSTFPEQNVALERRFDQFYAMREPAETAQLLNQRLAADPGVEEYLTMAYVAADLASGRMRMVQAGHSPPLLLRADGSHDFIGDGGLPIGLVDEVSYDQHDFQLQSGDRLLLYSDGFTEAVMKNGEMLGDDGLVEIFRESARFGSGPDLLEDMFWRLTQQMESAAKLGDDVSAALLEFDVLKDARA